MLRAQKEEKVATLQEAFQAAEVVIVGHQAKMTVAETTALRRKLRDAGTTFRVTKNRLARIALEGSQFEQLDDMFVGPTFVAFGTDPVASAKALVDYAKTNEKITILGGALGPQRLDDAAVKALTDLPSIEELRAKIVGVLQQPAAKMVGVLEAPAGKLARVMAAPPRDMIGVLKAYAAKEAA